MGPSASRGRTPFVRGSGHLGDQRPTPLGTRVARGLCALVIMASVPIVRRVALDRQDPEATDVVAETLMLAWNVILEHVEGAGLIHATRAESR